MAGRVGIENDGARNGAYAEPQELPPAAPARQFHARGDHSDTAPVVSAVSLDEVYRCLLSGRARQPEG